MPPVDFSKYTNISSVKIYILHSNIYVPNKTDLNFNLKQKMSLPENQSI